MATESFLVSALPVSADPAQSVHVSLFVAHRLTPDGAEGVVADFANVADWTARLSGASIGLTGRTGGGAAVTIPVTADLSLLDPGLWPNVFPPGLVVRGWQPRDLTATPWRTFAAHRMQRHAMLAHAVSVFSSPVAPPSVAGNALTVQTMNAIGLGQFSRRLRVEDLLDPEFSLDDMSTKFLDDVTGGGFLGAGTSPESSIGQNPVGLLAADVHRARRYYQHPEEQQDYEPHPIPNAVGVPISKPTPDFHERASMLGDLSPLLRRLGLVIDLHLDDLATLAGVVELQASLIVPDLVNVTPHQPRTSCLAIGKALFATSASGDYEGPLLRLGDEDRFTVVDLDPDASALKLEQYVRTIPRLLATETNGDSTNSAPPALRATGFAVARNDRAADLHDRVDDAAARTTAMLNGTAPPLHIEEITRGIRLEVWDDVSNQWSSLHRRRLDVEVDGAGTVLADAEDTGFLQGAALTRADDADGGVEGAPMQAHEVLAGWDGWSLSAPRPGKIVVHENGTEVLKDAPDPVPDPVNPVQSTTRVEPLTLPRLRYGRNYAFRAWAVDLAGNSAPHEVAGASVPAPPVDDVSGAAASVAAAHLSEMTVDATAIRAGATLLSPMPGALAALRELHPQQEPGPRDGEGALGLDASAIAPTGLEEVDRVVRDRLTRRRQRTERQTTSKRALIETTFTAHTHQAATLFERTEARIASDVFARALTTAAATHVAQPSADVAALIALLADLVTTPRPFLRWDPVIEPAVVPRHPYTEAESLLTLVVRSGVTGPSTDGGLDLTIVPPATFASDVLAAHPDLELVWRADSQRHLAPPKASQFDAELHGMFDAAFGSGNATAIRDALAVALRESGTFLDTSIADITNPGARLAQPGVEFHSSPTAEVPAAPTPDDLVRGDPLTPGQYVVHDVDDLVVPYLPDPLATGLSMVFPDAGQDHRLAGLFAIEGVTHRYSGDWPEPHPARLVLQSGAELAADIVDDVITMRVPPGEQLRFKLSTSMERSALALLGLWRSLPVVLQNIDFLAEAAADGWLWWLTPATELRLIHAVPRPIESPRPTVLVPVRVAGDTAVTLFGGVDVHGPSTERIDLEASWTEWIDDLANPGPAEIDVRAAAADTTVGYDEDLIVVAGVDQDVPLPDGDVVHVHKMIHQLGDTRHRDIDYRFRATTRYREYFDPRLLPTADDVSVLGPIRRLDVPSTARPAKPIVHDVLPLFRWFEETEPNQPFGLRRERRAGLRLYLERPWFTSGNGELLGVVLAFGSDALSEDHVCQWGADPVFWQQGPARRAALPLVDLMHLIGLDDRRQGGRPVGPPTPLTLTDVAGNPAVLVLGYEPEFSVERGMWFVDIALDPGTAIWPFVRLAVARLQPSSLPGLHLSPVVRCDPVQLPPERIATLSRPDDRHARVVITGPVGVPRSAVTSSTVPPGFLQLLLASRTMRIRLERRLPQVKTDLGWQTIATQDLPILGIDGTTVSWTGTVELPTAINPARPGGNTNWRVTVEEWERLPADPLPTGLPSTEARIVYADHLPL